jgi:hypothetical protein
MTNLSSPVMPALRAGACWVIVVMDVSPTVVDIGDIISV